MIQERKKHPSALLLTELFPEQEPLKTIYYKMLKGTNTYQSGTEIGHPPLGDYFCIDQSQIKNPISFGAASSLLLHALFGDEIASEILKSEKGAMGAKAHSSLSYQIRIRAAAWTASWQKDPARRL